MRVATVFKRVNDATMRSVFSILMMLALVPGVRGAEVTAELHVPEAPVYVLGDDIPLVWRFTNESEQPLAMLWEGCCRLNGKLDVLENNRPLDVLPPGASSYHSFSKAETLQPDQPAEFRSRLRDWVKLPSGGTFQLSGRYTGVLESQTPQVPDDVGLWRGTASASSASVRVLDVAEYLAQRKDREAERGLRIRLDGPSALEPITAGTYDVTFENLTPEPKTFQWPGPMELWLVDEAGLRLESGTRYLDNTLETITLPAGGEATRQITIGSEDLDGAEFGRLRVFLDLAATEAEGPRVPSNPLDVMWNISAVQTAGLLDQAAGGPSTGLRNPSLRLLRTHLAALTPRLQRIPDGHLGERAEKLRHDLLFAAAVKPLAPVPGRVEVELRLAANGSLRWDELSRLDPGIAAMSPTAVLSRISGVKRHLGWDLAPAYHLSSRATLADWSRAHADLVEGNDDLSAAPVWLLMDAVEGLTNRVTLAMEPVGTAVVVAMDDAGDLSFAAKPGQPGRPAWMNVIRPPEIPELSFTEVDTAKALRESIARANPSSPSIQILAPESTAFGDLEGVVRELIPIASKITVVVGGLKPSAAPGG